MSLQWLALWKSYTSYRHDATVWSNNWKDFVVCDEPSLSYNHNQHMHLGRTPVSASDVNNQSWRRLENEHGVSYAFSIFSI